MPTHIHTCTPTLAPTCAQTSMFVHAKILGGKRGERNRGERDRVEREAGRNGGRKRGE